MGQSNLCQCARPLRAPRFSLNTISRTQSWAGLELPGAAFRLLCQSHGFFMISLCLGSWFAWGGCFGNTKIFLPLFMCASTVHFSRRNGSLIDFLTVRKRLPHDKYLRLIGKGDHHLLKHQPRNYFPREGNKWISILCNICSARDSLQRFSLISLDLHNNPIEVDRAQITRIIKIPHFFFLFSSQIRAIKA